MVYATSKFLFGKFYSPLHLPLEPDAVFKKQRASKAPIRLQDKVNRFLGILEQIEIISPLISPVCYYCLLSCFFLSNKFYFFAYIIQLQDRIFCFEINECGVLWFVYFLTYLLA